MDNFAETILIVEDDNQIKNYIQHILTGEQYKCMTASTAHEALQHLTNHQINVILLDLGLPDYDGLEVIKKVREWSEVPIIVVSARDQDKSKVDALSYGADDYLTKPFSGKELIARIKVSLRHFYRLGSRKKENIASVGELSLDFEKHIVKLNGEILHLTPLEYSLLATLMKNVGKVMTSGVILREVWGVGYGNDTQVLRATMAGLRRKIEENPASPRYIITEMGVGYRLSEE